MQFSQRKMNRKYLVQLQTTIDAVGILQCLISKIYMAMMRSWLVAFTQNQLLSSTIETNTVIDSLPTST